MKPLAIRQFAARQFAALVFVLLAIPASGVAQPSPDDRLRSAYEKENAYLQAQREALEARLGRLDVREAEQVGAAQNDLDAVQGRLYSLQAEADRLQETLVQVQRDAEQAGTGSEVVESTVEQANTTFEKWGRSVQVSHDDDQKANGEPDHAGVVAALFSTGRELMEEHQSVRFQRGEFFLADGTKTSGEIVRIGNVAAYGVSEKAAGALAPAGDGRLKLWGKNAATTARALARGERPETLQAFLFESLDKAVEEPKEKTWLEVVDSGGVIAWVIVGLGLLGMLLVLGRVMILWRAGAHTKSLISEAGKLVAGGAFKEAIQRCDRATGAAAQVLSRTLAHIDAEREELEDVVSEAILHELPTLERFGSAIIVFAAVAPLLGLLGTVTGMISTFDIITEFGTGDPKLLSGGISEALVTTQLGLIVAIPLLLIGNVLKGWSTNITTHIERGALRLMNLARLRHGDDEDCSDNPSDKSGLKEVEMPQATEYLGAI